MTARYAVYAGEDLVLTVRAEPGPLTSTAPPVPGGRPPLHPFLSAAARDASHEESLRELLDASEDLQEFLGRLRAAGYTVERDD